MRRIIGEILKIEREQKRRYDNNALARYNVGRVHAKQMEFHKCDKRNRWVFGGNRTGKTECGAAETVWLARGIHPYKENKRTDGWVVSLSRRVQREVAQKKILHYLNPDWIVDIVMDSGKAQNPSGGIIDYIAVRNVFGTVSTIGFKTCEAGRDKFAGASLDYVWFDEEPPEDVYDECAMRVVDKKGLLFGTMTPLLGLTFVYRRIYLNCNNDPEVWHIFMEWSDNPYLDKAEVDRVSAAMTDAERDVRRYGRFVDAKGAVYTEFDERVHVIKPFPRNGKRQDTAPESGQADVHGDARQVLRPHLPKAQRSGATYGYNALTGRVIESDLFGVCDRLKSIDDGYFVFLNYKTGKLEVHNSKCAPSTLCLVLPYDTLDERTVRRVRETRAERVAELIERTERENARLAAAQAKATVEKAASALFG